MEKDRLDQMRHEIELLKSQVSLENKVKEENAQLAARLLEEKRQTDEAMNNRMRDKLKVEVKYRKNTTLLITTANLTKPLQKLSIYF